MTEEENCNWHLEWCLAFEPDADDGPSYPMVSHDMVIRNYYMKKRCESGRNTIPGVSVHPMSESNVPYPEPIGHTEAPLNNLALYNVGSNVGFASRSDFEEWLDTLVVSVDLDGVQDSWADGDCWQSPIEDEPCSGTLEPKINLAVDDSAPSTTSSKQEPRLGNTGDDNDQPSLVLNGCGTDYEQVYTIKSPDGTPITIPPATGSGPTLKLRLWVKWGCNTCPDD